MLGFGVLLGGTWLGNAIYRRLPVVLPHHLLQYLHEKGMSADALDREANREYWAHMVEHTEWAASHPCSQYPETSIPTFLYGDDVKYNRQEKLTCTYLGFILADKKGLAMRTHFPIFIVREACAVLMTENINRNSTNVNF